MGLKLSAEKRTPEPGDVLAGKYRVERILGRGGMGIVAAAWDMALERTVALKVLRPEGADDESLERFTRESRAISQLRSEHIVRMYDAGVLDDGTPFLVMEHLVGEDLDTILASRVLSPEEAVMYLLQTCEGLAEAHAHGIVHRDLKPANLFVTTRPDGRPLLKIVDFGVAKQIDRRSLVELTAPLVAVGSVLYMSPEQARAAQTIAPTSDIFSLGVCLYELLTRRQPFDGDTTFDILANVIKETPASPELLVAELPSELAAVVMRCLEKDPAARYQDVASLAEDLEPFAGPLADGAAVRTRLVLGGAAEMLVRPPKRVPIVLTSPRDAEVADGAKLARIEVETRAAPTNASERAATGSKRRPAFVAAAAIGAIAAVTAAAVLVRSREHARAEGTDAAQTSGTDGASLGRVAAAASAPEPTTTATTPEAAPSASQRVALPRTTRAGALTTTAREPTSSVRSPPSTLAIAASPPSASTPAVAPPAATTTPEAPRFVLASAHVQIGTAKNVLGSSTSNVSRTLAPLAAKVTSCYRDALPRMTGTVEGAGSLYLATDEEGLIVSARLDGPVTAPARCITAAVTGRRVPNVDTGRASAEVPLVFVAQ